MFLAKIPFIPEVVTTVNRNQLPSLPTSKFEILLDSVQLDIYHNLCSTFWDFD